MRRRHRYKEDYVIKEEVLKDGKHKKETVVYQGEFYDLQVSSKQKQKTTVCMFAGILLSLLIFVLVGSLNNEGSRIIYIMIPYVCLFLSFYYELTGCFLLSRVKQKMTKLEYQNSLLRLKKSSMSGIILGFMSILGEILTVFYGDFEFMNQKELIFISGLLLITVSNIVVQKNTEWLIKQTIVTKQ